MAHLLLLLIYLTFISLGLPDALLGSAWPNMHVDLNVPISYAGFISVTITVGTIISSIFSAKLNRKFGIYVVFFSVALTALALFGFSISTKFYMLILFAIPYGLGAGGIDSALNNYVAKHYKANHMSWLHSMWGIGFTVGPYVMGFVLTNNNPWNDGYKIISLIQVCILVILMLSIPLWRKQMKINEEEGVTEEKVTFKEVFKTKGVLVLLITFFCYCALEQTTALWATTYLVEKINIDANTAAYFASLFCIGITVGRVINGFIAMKLKDRQMIRIGIGIILIGIILVLINVNTFISYAGFVLIGIGCAPIFPSVIHSIPRYFGKISSTLIGVAMASAYLGVMVMPPLFGVIAQYITVNILPFYLLGLLIILCFGHEILLKKVKISYDFKMED